MTCSVTGKRCYSQKEANNVIKHAHLAATVGKKRQPMRSYYCKACHNYHLTHFKSFMKLGEKSTKYEYRKKKENYKNHIGEEEE